MNWGKDKNITFHIYILLEVNAYFLTLKTTWESLTLNVIMGHYLGTQKHPRHIESTTLKPQSWKKLSM